MLHLRERFLFAEGEEQSVLFDNEGAESVETIVVRSRAGAVLSPADCHRQVVRRGQ